MKVALGIVCVFVCFASVYCASSHYYEMADDILSGVDYYKMMGVAETATTPEVKKAYRKLSILYHPDKNPSVEAKEMFLLLTRVADILTDEGARAEYDTMVRDGVPLGARIYGRYAHRYGAPVHDVRLVFASLFLVVTVAKHIFQRNKYHKVMGLAKKSATYQQEYKRQIEEGIENPDVPLEVVGVSAPTWKDLLPVQVVMLPYYIYHLVLFCMKPAKTQAQLEEEYMIANNLTREQFERQKELQAERMKEKMQGGKYKKYLRYMKKKQAEKQVKMQM